MKGIFAILNYYFSPGRWAAQRPLTTAPAAIGDRNLQIAQYSKTVMMLGVMVLGYLLSGLFAGEFQLKSDALFFPPSMAEEEPLPQK